jgi:peptidoglycan hydrolase-like protein with peptidoglycan-binding domain
MVGDQRLQSDRRYPAASGGTRPVCPRGAGDPAVHPILQLQRLAGNNATRLLLQRLDADDAQDIEDIAGYTANPLVYGAGKVLGNLPAVEKYGEWAAGKYEKYAGEDSSPLLGPGSPEEEDGGVIHEDAIGPTLGPSWWQSDVVDAKYEEAMEPLGGPVSHGGGAPGKGPGGKGPGGKPSAGAAPAGEPETTGGDPLSGLRPGDGLDVGTWHRRPRVKLLQYRLNVAGGAGLKVDGMWGKRTTAALESFQLSHDLVPTSTVDAATAAALRSERAPGGQETTAPAAGTAGSTTDEGPAGAEGAGSAATALPDISGLVAPEILARWQNPLAAPPGTTLSGGPASGAAAGPAQGGLTAGASTGPAGGAASGFVGGEGGAPAAAGEAGPAGAGAAQGYVIKTDTATLARFEYYKPVLYDMYERYNRAAQETQAYFALLQQSAAVAAYYGSRAFSSICASLAGIVLGPPGFILWNLANEFWGLGARMAAEAEKPILEAATGPALDALIAFGNVVQVSFNEAYPMREPTMPWYVVGAGAIAPPTSTLLNAYQQVRSLQPR